MDAQDAISEARCILSNIECRENVFPGDLILIEKEIETDLKWTGHPSRDSLLPILCVMANNGSWLGLLGGLLIGHTPDRRRSLAALDFYTGYFTPRPNCWSVKKLQHGVWRVGTFTSTSSPLTPLPPPLIDII